MKFTGGGNGWKYNLRLGVSVHMFQDIQVEILPIA